MSISLGRRSTKATRCSRSTVQSYSSTQEEYLLALKTRDDLAKLGGAPRGEDNGLVAAARRKLELWDIPESQRWTKSSELGRRRRRSRCIHRHRASSPRKDVVEGMKLDAGAMPYEIVDLSAVWVLADVYESELRLVKEGMAATLTLAAFPNREFKGKVVFFDPLLDPQTRTVKVRITVPNPSGELRPEMFGEVVLLGSKHDANTIPADAVIDSGTEKVVFVAVGEGKFEPRVLKMGLSDGSRVEVVSGLSLGERVVTRANFLVDSESRLRASLAAVGGGARARSPWKARAYCLRSVCRRRPTARPERARAMIRRVIRFSAENRYLVIAATMVALVFAWWSMKNIPLDALPDLSDTQVIVYVRWDRSPDIIEDQVTYPMTTALLGAPKVKAIRGFSDFGFSYVYVIFEDGTDMYWARSRVLEYLSKITSQLPQGVKVELGPDASSVGWVFQYALVDKTGKHSSDELRSYQDWFLRYAVQSVPGVSEVASVGGQVRQYQVTVNPNAAGSLQAAAEQRDRRRSAAGTMTWAGASSSYPAANTWCAAAAT